MSDRVFAVIVILVVWLLVLSAWVARIGEQVGVEWLPPR